jgi:hypothetical protein
MDICVIVGMIMANMEKQGNTSVTVCVLGMRERSAVDFGGILCIHPVCSVILFHRIYPDNCC